MYIQAIMLEHVYMYTCIYRPMCAYICIFLSPRHSVTTTAACHCCKHHTSCAELGWSLHCSIFSTIIVSSVVGQQRGGTPFLHFFHGGTRSSTMFQYMYFRLVIVSKYGIMVFKTSPAYRASALWNELPRDPRQISRPPCPPLNFTHHPLALSSATFHSRLKSELRNIGL